MPALPANNRLGGSSRLRPLALALLLAGAGSASAQWLPQRPPGDDPWHIGVSQAFTRDSNVFRVNEGEQSDTISSTALLGGVNMRLGRQQLRADAVVSRHNFSDAETLDHTAYRAGVRLDWETIGRLSGDVDVRTRKELVRPDEISGIGGLRTLRKVDTASIAGRLGATSLLAIEARLAHQRAEYDTLAPLDHDQNSASLGVLYRPSGALTLGVAGRYTEGEYPNNVIGDTLAPDDFDRKDVDFTAAWEPTGISRLSARVSATKVDHTQPNRGDVSGVTGALQWDWRPTGKLRFLTDLSRDTGTQTTFAQFVDPVTGDVYTSTGATSRFVNALRLRGFWDATAKIQVTGDLRYAERRFESGVASDRTTGIALGARYEFNRALALGCSVGHDTRSSSADAREYDVNLATCFAQFVLH